MRSSHFFRANPINEKLMNRVPCVSCVCVCVWIYYTVCGRNIVYRARSKHIVCVFPRRRHFRSDGFGVPVVELRVLVCRSRMSRTSGCQYRGRGWRQGRPAGAPGPRRAWRLTRARGSVYRPRHGKPCPPLLPPRQPLAKREQRDENVSFTSLCPLPVLKELCFLFFFFCEKSLGCFRRLSLHCGISAKWLESGSLKALESCNQKDLHEGKEDLRLDILRSIVFL